MAVVVLVLLMLIGGTGHTTPPNAPSAVLRTGDGVAVTPSWTQVTTAQGPSNGSGPMVFDSADGYLLLYQNGAGGANPSSPCGSPSLWNFAHRTWNQLAAGSAPRFDTSVMAYDARDGYVVLFGGCGTRSNETWTYQGGQWVNVTLPTAPPARETTAMAYDPVAKDVVLFGGYSYFNATTGAGYRVSDTWEFQGRNWSNASSMVSPPARNLHALAPASTDGSLILFGGLPDKESFAADTWTFHSDTWHNVSAKFGPSARWMPALADDPADHGTILFGGQGPSFDPEGGNVLGDTWRFGAKAWQQLGVGGYPPPRVGADLVFDALDGYLVMFGGAGAGGLLHDTWVFSTGVAPVACTLLGGCGTFWGYVGIVAAGIVGISAVSFFRGRNRARATRSPDGTA